MDSQCAAAASRDHHLGLPVPKKKNPGEDYLCPRSLVCGCIMQTSLILIFYWQLNSVIAITFSCIDSIDCSPFSRNERFIWNASKGFHTFICEFFAKRTNERNNHWSLNSHQTVWTVSRNDTRHVQCDRNNRAKSLGNYNNQSVLPTDKWHLPKHSN